MKSLFLAMTALIVCPWSMAVAADQRDDALSAIQRCTELSDGQARLNCYDHASPAAHPAAAPLPAAIPPPKVPEPARQHQSILGAIFGNAPRAPQTSVAEFGSESVELNGKSSSAARVRGDTINAISARMTSYAFTSPGAITVTLDNAQVWRQISAGNYTHLVKPAASYGVTINRGSFGSYKMTISGIPEVLEVRRIR